MEECIQLIMAEVQRRGYSNHHTLAYQSRVGPVEWLKPYTDDSIRWAGCCCGSWLAGWLAGCPRLYPPRPAGGRTCMLLQAAAGARVCTLPGQ
jgi:hypothetical protein